MKSQVLLLVLACVAAIVHADTLLRHQHRSGSKQGHGLSSASRTVTGDVECPFAEPTIHGDIYTATSFDKCDVVNQPSVFSKLCSEDDRIATPEESVTSIVRWIALKFQETHADRMTFVDILQGLKQDCSPVLIRFRKCRVEPFQHGGISFMRASVLPADLEAREDAKRCEELGKWEEDEEIIDREINKYIKHVVIGLLVANGDMVRDPEHLNELRFARIDFTVANTCEEGWERGLLAFDRVSEALESLVYEQSLVQKCFRHSEIIKESNVDQFTSWFHHIINQAPVTINFGLTKDRALAMAKGVQQGDHIKNAFELLATSSAISFMYTCANEDYNLVQTPGYIIDCPKEIHYRPDMNYAIREAVENGLFGFQSEIGGRRIFDDLAQSCERPVYGALNVLGLSTGSAPGYGSSFLTLKQSVKKRSTFAATDTFFLPGITTPLRLVYSPYYTFKPEQGLSETAKYQLATVHTTENLLRNMDFGLLDEFASVWDKDDQYFETFDKKKLKYIEVEILGGVKYSDVESVSLDPAIFPEDSEQRVLMEQWAATNHITVHIL